MASTAIEIGRKAPGFSLANQDGQKVSLRDLEGSWVVVYFYPRDDTPGCTKEACEFTSQLGQFGQLGAKVLGISPDSVGSHRKFRQKHQLQVELLSDPDHTVAKKYGAWGEKSMYGKKYEGIIRSTVLVDPHGRVSYYWPKVAPAGHAAEVLAKLAELQRV
ncbi:MAG: thioredoxin-dependent thiol peroxidase [Thermoguttaceae bacterium]|jgi:peroxiredoxin Q/BCP|nr:thioredoxin-dependent thiol peroxidase [Thermoguttaceae bacterium]